MIIPDRKKAIGVILSKMKPDGSQVEGGEMKNEEHIDEHEQALHSHAEDILSALHNKSAADLAKALNNFLEEHDMHEQEESPEEERAEHSEEE